LYLPAKRPTALAKTDNKEKTTKVAVVNNKKAAWSQVEEVSDSEPANVFNSENK